MPKNQTTLNSFFGGIPPAKKKSPQTKLDSFFGKKSNAATAAAADAGESKAVDPVIEQQGKENNQNKRSNIETDEAKPKKAKMSADLQRQRRVIDDDSDSDDEETTEAIIDDSKPTAKEGADLSKDSNINNKEDDKSKTSPTLKKASDEEKLAVKKGGLMDAPKKNKAESSAADDKEISKEASKAVGSSKKSTTTEKITSTKAQKMDQPASTSSSASLDYIHVCEAFEKIEAITARLQIQEIVTNLFREQIDSGNPENIYPLMYLCSNTVAPAYECVELGIGDAILIKAIAEACGTNAATVKTKYEELGDLGQVAASFKGKQKTLGGFFTTTKTQTKKNLGCQEILNTFREISKMKGNQSQKHKVEMIKKLLRNAQASEPKYIIRALQGKLRIGLAESTVLISLAHALTSSVPPEAEKKEASFTKEELAEMMKHFPEEAKEYYNKKNSHEKRIEAAVAIVKKAYSEVPSFDALIDAVVAEPLFLLHKACTLTPGIPVAPMLAKPTKSVQEVLKRLGGQRFTCEYKYDGERAQVHMLEDGSFRVFSRNLLDTSEKYPEVPLFVKEAASDEVKSFVCDAEVVAYDLKKERLVPFQVLSTRKKTEESAETAKVQVIVQAFDLMYLNGESLLGRTLQERRDLMKKHFSVVPGKFKFAVSIDHEENGDFSLIEDFLDEAVKGQCEGLMVKTLDEDAIYEPSRRSLNWLKLKKDYLEGLGDSVDLVPIGAYYGRGKRTGVYGAYLLACYDLDTEEFQSVCKIGTGFSDEDLKTLSASLNQHKIPKKTSQYNVTDQLECDVWFDSVQVWEVKAADLSKSSTHRGAVGKTGEEGRGIGLRFPRFERIREDKSPHMATTSDQILEMYYNQDSVGGNDGSMDDGI